MSPLQGPPISQVGQQAFNSVHFLVKTTASGNRMRPRGRTGAQAGSGPPAARPVRVDQHVVQVQHQRLDVPRGGGQVGEEAVGRRVGVLLHLPLQVPPLLGVPLHHRHPELRVRSGGVSLGAKGGPALAGELGTCHRSRKRAKKRQTAAWRRAAVHAPSGVHAAPGRRKEPSSLSHRPRIEHCTGGVLTELPAKAFSGFSSVSDTVRSTWRWQGRAEPGRSHTELSHER